MGSTTTTTNYLHPYITIQIYDNTEFVEEEVVEERKSFNGMQVGFFAGGRDNKLLYMADKTSELREFGKPNYKALGQAAYNVDNALATGNCGMYIMNLRPDTATLANIVIMARFKVQVDGGTEGTTEETGGSSSNTSESSGSSSSGSGTSTDTGSGTSTGGGTGSSTTEHTGDEYTIGYYSPNEALVYIKSTSDNLYYSYDVTDIDVEDIDGVHREETQSEIDTAEEEGTLIKVRWSSQDDLDAIVEGWTTEAEIPSQFTTFDDEEPSGSGGGMTEEDEEGDDNGSTIPAADAGDATTGDGEDETDDGEDTTNATEVTKTLVYSFYPKYVEGATTEAALKAAVNSLVEVDPDENGYYNMPIFAFYAQGRGEYGNSIHLRFSNVTTYVPIDGLFMEYETPTAHIYTVTVMEPGNEGLENREVGTGTMDIDGFDASVDWGPSTYLEDVINDLETGSLRIKTMVFSETLDAITELYNNNVVENGTETPYTLDLLTGYNLEGAVNTNLVLDTTAEDYINLMSLDGFTLAQGSDGWEDMSEEEISATKNNLLVAAYAGDLDPYIKSRFSSPVNFNLDANYDLIVKKQMAALANLRKYDCMTYLDTGMPATTSGLINVGVLMRNLYGFNVIKEGHSYKYRDTEYTGKLCNFTITHWLAKALPNHMATEDTIYGATLARDTAILRSKRDYIQGTFLPVIDPDMDDIKETLYKLRINCYETLTYNSVQRSTAITSCQTNSDRLLEMNEYILQRAVKIAYDLIASKLYKFGEEADRARYEEEASDVLANELKKYVRAASVQFEMTKKDEKKSLLRLKLHLTFKTVIQRGELEIYLDPRVVDDTIAA